MNKILAALAAIMTWVIGQKDNTKALKKQVADRDKVIAERDAEIERLLAVIEADKTDDATLEAAATEARERQVAAEARTKELEDERLVTEDAIKVAEAEADKLVASINDDPEVPVTVVDGVVTTTAAPAAPVAKPPLGSE